MLNKINQFFNFHQQALNLFSKRQEILSSNIANADTPGYKSIDINFKNELDKMIKKDRCIFLKTTSVNHFNTKNKNLFSFKTEPVTPIQIKPDGNTVNMDRERIEFLKNNLKYQSSLAFIKNEIKSMIYVLKG